jgi:NADH dehydrogenase
VEDRQVSVIGVGTDASRTKIGYDRLVLAAGSRLFRPDVPGLERRPMTKGTTRRCRASMR